MRALKWLLTSLVAFILVHCGGGESARDAAESTSAAALEVCVAQWSPTWQQGSGANEWWVEYAITGATVAKAHLEIVGTGAIVPLSPQWNKWGGPSARIVKGAQVVVHAETTTGQKAQTKPFGYLDVTAPVTDPCTGGADGGVSDGGTCTNPWTPTWSQGSGANEWWVEYAVTGGTVTSASLEVIDIGSVTLQRSWSKWVGPAGFRIPRGTQVIMHAASSLGQTAQTQPFPYLDDPNPATKPCTSTDAGTDGGIITAADVYDPNKILTYELGFDAAALAVLSNTSMIEADMKAWVHGTFKCGSTVFADVGVRRKGHSTFRALPQKAAFKIRFDRYVPGQYFVGFRDLTLNNSTSDPTFLVERLSYQVFRSVGLPAPRAASAQVTINGAPWGLYANVETPNKQLNDRLFGADAKTFYEVNYGSQWLPGVEGGFEEEVGDGSLSDVTALLDAVNAAQNGTLLVDVASNLNTTEWLKFSATEATVGHYDGYAFGIWGSHNYFMAGDVNGRFSLLPWSTDLTMSNRATVVNANQPRDTIGGGPTLLGRCKLSTTCWNAYKAQVKIVLAGYESLGPVALAKTWHAQVHPFVLADPKRETSDSYYTTETTNLYAWLAARPGVVRTQLGIAP